MRLDILITSDPLPARVAPPAEWQGATGAVAEFAGLVRDTENGRRIAALEYEAYTPMAEKVMRRILEELGAAHPCHWVRVAHRVGRVPAGEPAIHIAAAAPHRAEALALVTRFMDRLKQEVPIWKCGVVPAAPAPPPGAVPQVATAAEVMALVGRLCAPLEAETVPLSAALGRTLRETVTAPEDQPAFDRSAVDGYAVRLDDASAEFRVVADIRAGEWKPRPLSPGEAVRIATGGALPAPELQVVMKEEAEVDGQRVRFRRRDAERNIRFRGEDARAGQPLVRAGTVLGEGALGLLASAGWHAPKVTRLPRVLHVVTGNEIVPPDATPAPGQIRDSNTPLVRAFLARRGVAPDRLRVGEDPDALSLLRERAAADGLDLLLISGGASVGEHDFTRRWLEALGCTVFISKTSARPGRPLVVAQRGPLLAFGLPGNPLAHFVCLHLYVRAALDAWAGQAAPGPVFHTGELAAPLPGDRHPRQTFWPAVWQFSDTVPRVTPLRWNSSGDLTALAAANALLQVPSGAGTLPAGARLPFLPC